MADKEKTAAQNAPAGYTDDMEARAAQEAARYTLLEAPIAELAEAESISIDEAVKLRVAAAIEAAPMKMEVTVRPIEPKGKLIGFASAKFGGGLAVEDFKVFDGENGLFVGMPSKSDPTSRTGYRNTVRITDRAMHESLNEATAGAYSAEVEKLQARAAAIRATPEKPRIREQMEKAGKEATRENAARPAPAKDKGTRNDR